MVNEFGPKLAFPRARRELLRSDLARDHGHATVGLTLDTYSHVIPGMQEDAVARIDAAFDGAVGKSIG